MEEEGKIAYGEVEVYPDGEFDQPAETLTFYLDCGDQ